MASTPTTAAKIASTARMPATRTTLSCDPKAEIAKLFTGGGVRPIDDSPTATTGEASGATNPAMSWPMPSATAAASSPAIMPRPIRAMSMSRVTLFIRGTVGGGLVCRAPGWLMDVPKDGFQAVDRYIHRDGLGATGPHPSRGAVGYEFRAWGM